MDIILPKLYKEYGSYSNFRNFPLDLDGLKPVERRVLLSAYKIARDKMVKSRQVDGHTIGHYHPHGECYGTIVQLVNQGFLEGQGNFGNNIGVEPIPASAPRYTECRLAKKTVELAFKYVKYVPWHDTELGDTEPIFLPAMFPLCLLGTNYTQGIGFGYKTLIPCYKLEDLKRRLFWLLGDRKTKIIIEPITDCEILSKPAALDELLTTGKAKIDVRGIIEEKKHKFEVVLKSWPPGKRFESLLSKFDTELDSGMVGYSDLSVNETKIVFQVLRERNREKIYTDFVEKLRSAIEGSISFENVVVDSNSKVLTKSIDNMLLDTFNMYKKINQAMLEDEAERLNKLIDQFKLLERMKPYLKVYMDKTENYGEVVEIIAGKLKVAKAQVDEILTKYQIKKLLTISTDTSEIEAVVKELEKNLKNLNNFVLEQYNSL